MKTRAKTICIRVSNEHHARYKELQQHLSRSAIRKMHENLIDKNHKKLLKLLASKGTATSTTAADKAHEEAAPCPLDDLE
jgi:hypothetical protein